MNDILEHYCIISVQNEKEVLHYNTVTHCLPSWIYLIHGARHCGIASFLKGLK